MAPFLDKESELVPGETYKFVRKKRTVAYGSKSDLHVQIALNHDIGSYNIKIFKQEGVDGAGSMRQLYDGSIELSGQSRGCVLTKPDATARAGDVKVIGKITGKEVTSRS